MYQNIDICNRLREILPDLEIKVQEPMCHHTTFRIGGPCDLMVLPHSEEQLQKILVFLYEKEIRPVILGGGSNVLVSDAGIRGVVILMKDALNEIKLLDETTIYAQSGVSMARLANFAAEHGLIGLEFAQGIPGTVGGGLYMNAGAYGGELKDTAVRTHVMRMDGAVVCVEGEEQGLGYRTSAFQRMDAVILGAEFSLTKGDSAAIRERMKDFGQRRRSKQPLELPSAGSTFKRPEGHFAGALIEEAGLKGYSVGGAMVSTKHAGFVVNVGGATASDVLALVRDVQEKVLANSGVLLEPEIRMI